jgi:cytochrome c peroxidase
MKKGATIAALVTAAILAGHSVSAQVAQPPQLPPALNRVRVREPDNIGDFIRDKTAAIALGKSLFWDMQVGSDGIQSCASCHFHAGADNRSKNQINPGQGNVFDVGGHANYQLTTTNYPFQSNINDVTGSQGIFKSDFVDVVPGSDKDNVTPQKDEVFNVQGTNVRQVTPRHTPSVINAVFNFRNFWDGRAQNIFNGVNAFGLRDPNAFVLKASNPNRLRQVRIKLNNSSLASQAVQPPTSQIEQSGGPFRPFIVAPQNAITADSGFTANTPNTGNTNADSTQELVEGSRVDQQYETLNPLFNDEQIGPLIPKKIGKKMLSLTPLGKQLVAKDDSVLGSYSKAPERGLNQSYESLIQKAFKPEWWNSDLIVSFDEQNNGTIIKKPNQPLTTKEVRLIEYNFSLFFGLAVQAYESTLISDRTPFDEYLGGNRSALTAQQQKGLEIFQTKGLCINCHTGSELTIASAENVARLGRIRRTPVPGNPAQDTGFFNIGVRPPQDDPGVDGNDDFGNTLSEIKLAQQNLIEPGIFKQLLGEDPPGNLNPPLQADEAVIADGAFKTPGLRNIELTAPYFHNGGQLTLEQVVEFYNRGGDFRRLPPLSLSDDEKQALVVFMKGLTDERVRFQKAPFDHPSLMVPNGHPGDQNAVAVDSNVQTGNDFKQAQDALLEIPAVGRNGGNPTPNFLGANAPNGGTMVR